MVDLFDKKDDIVRLMFWFNIIVFIISIFYFEKWFSFVGLWINILCLGSFLMIKKNNSIFEGMKKSGKLASGLDKKLVKIYG